jgi:Beta-ketoacyl synthase, N-terminal domain
VSAPPILGRGADGLAAAARASAVPASPVPASPVPASPVPASPVPASAGDLVVLARAEWPASPADRLPALPGFITSSFSPLAAEVAEQCLRRYFGPPPATPELGEHTAVVLASSTGDIVTAAAVASAVDEGRRVPPLLFFQSNQNAVVGYIAARWGLAGPVACTIPLGDALDDAMASAAALIEDGDARAALVIVADQGPGDADRGTALLLGPPSWPEAGSPAGRSGIPLHSGSPAIVPETAPGGR